MATLPPSVRRILRPLKRRVNQWLGRELPFRPQLRCDTIRLGSEYGGWVVRPERITPSTIVYCFGVGEDITFDLAMIERFDVTVHAFDPTPKAMAWVRSQSTPPKLVFHNVGLADYDGTARFVLPRADYASYHIGQAQEKGADAAECRVQRLSTIMRDLRHDHIDVLKMDIEGAEYAAIDDMIQSRIFPAQLLVEFHHKAGDRQSLERTSRSIKSLQEAGYGIFDVSPTGLEYSFSR